METTPDHRPALRSWALLLLTLAPSLLAGCEKKPDPPPPEPVVRPPPPGVSILQITPARLALDWQFGMAGTPFTGWEGKWLSLRLPRDAHVSAFRMKATARVAVWRDGTKLKEASLEGESLVPIDTAGGDFRIEALGAPMHVRDFDVLGQPGAERQSVPKLPGVRFGSLDAGENISGPWPRLLAYCEKSGGDHCNEGVSVARQRDLAVALAGNSFTDLAIETPRGWFIVSGTKRIDRESIRIEKPEAGTPFVRFEHDDRSDDVVGARLDGDIGKTYIEATRRLVVCRVIDGWVDCDERHDLALWKGEVALARRPAPFPPPSGKYADVKVPRVLDDGGVVVP